MTWMDGEIAAWRHALNTDQLGVADVDDIIDNLEQQRDRAETAEAKLAQLTNLAALLPKIELLESLSDTIAIAAVAVRDEVRNILDGEPTPLTTSPEGDRK